MSNDLKEKEKVQDLEGYIGVYRVKYEQTSKDGEGKTEKLESMYIPCKRKVEIYRYNKDKLNILFPSKYFAKSIIKQLNEIHSEVDIKIFLECDKEMILQINESDLGVIAEYINPKVQGKDIKPQNKFKSRVNNGEKKGTYDMFPFSKRKNKGDEVAGNV